MNAMRGVRLCLIAAMAIGASGRASAAPKPELKTESVTFASGDEKAPGYLVLPSAEGKHPAVIVIHEWWGLNDWVKEKTRGFAGDGAVSLAVDLYRGRVAADADTAHQLMRGMPEDRALRDLEGAFNYLASRPDVDPSHIGVVGWCMGGGQALSLAIAEPKLAAAVVYYGRLVTDPATIEKIKTPLLGNFGADDQGITPESVKAFSAAAKKAGVKADFKVYPNAGHGFASNHDPKIFKTEAARDADRRTSSFFAQHLKMKR